MQDPVGATAHWSIDQIQENDILAELESILVKVEARIVQGEGTKRPERSRRRGFLALVLGIAVALALIPAGSKVSDLASKAATRQAANAND